MRLNKGIPTLPTLNKIPFGLGFIIPFGLGFRHPSCSSGYPSCSFRNQASGFRLQGLIVSIVGNFTVLLFYFFKKKKIKNIRTFRSTFLKSLKYKDKINFFCSKIVQHARTYVNQHFFTFRILKT
jgi:hypothetical protein